MAYYDGTKLLSMSDINGNKPEIYICTSNRTGGKTTYWNRYAVNRFIKRGEKFMLIYRFNYELTNVNERFFKDINTLFFPEYNMTAKTSMTNAYVELFLNEHPCGYAVALNASENVKKMSHVFTDVATMLFDEFQSETNKYCSQEVEKLMSIHTSVARGQGKQARYVPVIMISNPVSLINPYYTALGISSRLRSDTKFLKGDGWVLEQGFIQSASEAQLTSGFNRAFASQKYLAYSAMNVYLNDSTAFVETVTGNNRYLCTLKYKGKNFAVRSYPDKGILYVDNSADLTFPVKIAVTTDDHAINYVMLANNALMILNMRNLFEKGCFRFKDLQCKECLMTAVSYL